MAKTIKQILLNRECRELRRMHRTAIRLRERGYQLKWIARHMQISEDDVWELLKEIPC